MRALLSVYDKTGLVDLATGLEELGWELVSSGGTSRALREAGIAHLEVAQVTGSPEMLGGRVKTLHPKIHGGILADRSKPEHLADLVAQGIEKTDLVVCNLYPFHSEPSIEMIDVGGPTMVRAAAKNHTHVGAVVDPADYAIVLAELKQLGSVLSDETRRKLARKAFAHTAAYDAAIVGWFDDTDPEPEVLPPTIHLTFHRPTELLYGENKDQSPAAFYRLDGVDDALGIDKCVPVEGDDPSYNNIVDIERMLQTTTHLVAGFNANFGEVPLVAVAAKHGNPCGAVVGYGAGQTIARMLEGDLRAIHGGLVMTNFPITAELADLLVHHKLGEGQSRRVLDGVIAPTVDKEAEAILRRKEGKCRVLINPALGRLTWASLDTARRFRYVRGGAVIQPNYTYVIDLGDGEMEKTDELPGALRHDLVQAWAICATSNSNTITLVKDGQLIGNGVGQQDRVGAAELALKRARDAGHDAHGSAAASDSFFPFPDGPERLAEGGVQVIFATTGSRQDDIVRKACKERGVVLWQLPDAKARAFSAH